MQFLLPEQGGMNGGPEADVVALLPLGAPEWEHDHVQGTAVGGSGNVEGVIDVFASLQVRKEGALRPHLPGPPSGIEVGHVGAVVRSGDGVEPLAAVGAIQLLEVIAGNQSPHAEGYNGELGVLTPFRIDEVAELSRHGLKALPAVHRLEGGHETFIATGHNGPAERPQADAGVKYTVDQDDLSLGNLGRLGGHLMVWPWFESGGAAGNHEDGKGEETGNEDGSHGCPVTIGGATGQVLLHPVLF